jgi:predicted HTH transcriptional regulator
MNGPILSFEEFVDLDIASNRHNGSEESTLAFQHVRNTIGEYHRDILRVMDRCGAMTSKELAAVLCRPLNSVSGRLTELRAGQWIEKTGLRRDGAAVLRRTKKEWR